MMVTALAISALVCAVIPAYLFACNVFRFYTLAASTQNDKSLPPLSVLIPARNEEASIGPCVESVLANLGAESEVIVLDDQSEDRTAQIVLDLASRDARVRLETAQTLPAGWCGKQYACSQLAQRSKHDVFVFLDADVRLTDGALDRMSQHFRDSSVDLLSGFPRQVTITIAERMLIPLIHFVLLGFLSLRRMRISGRPAFGAGCGQLFMTSRHAYEAAGGHAVIRSSLHDGLQLPRAYRRRNLATDVFDATDLATCRMYRNATEVWQGLKKNATEGVASARLIIPVSLMLICGQVLPFVLCIGGLVGSYSKLDGVVILASLLLAWLPRFVAAVQYRQSFLGAMLHPISILLFLSIQWSAFWGSFSRRQVAWKGRPYPA